MKQLSYIFEEDQVADSAATTTIVVFYGSQTFCAFLIGNGRQTFSSCIFGLKLLFEIYT